MMREELYQYCVIRQPSNEEHKKGVRAKLVVPVSEPFLARSPDEVKMIATQEIPKEYMADADQLEVVVRPF